MMAAHLVLVPKSRKVLKDRMTLIIKMTHTDSLLHCMWWWATRTRLRRHNMVLGKVNGLLANALKTFVNVTKILKHLNKENGWLTIPLLSLFLPTLPFTFLSFQTSKHAIRKYHAQTSCGQWWVGVGLPHRFWA